MPVENPSLPTTSTSRTNGIEQVYRDLEQMGFHEEMYQAHIQESPLQSRRPASQPDTPPSKPQ